MPKVLLFFGFSDLFSIFRFPFDFLSLAHFKRDATKSSLTLEIVHCRWVCLAAISIVCMLDYVNDIGPSHATPLLCLAANAVAKMLLIHCGVAMFQLFSTADTPLSLHLLGK